MGQNFSQHSNLVVPICFKRDQMRDPIPPISIWPPRRIHWKSQTNPWCDRLQQSCPRLHCYFSNWPFQLFFCTRICQSLFEIFMQKLPNELIALPPFFICQLVLKWIRDDHPTLVSNKHASFNTIYAKPADFTTVDLYKLFNELWVTSEPWKFYTHLLPSMRNRRNLPLRQTRTTTPTTKKNDYEFFPLKNFPPSGPKGTISKFIKDWTDGPNQTTPNGVLCFFVEEMVTAPKTAHTYRLKTDDPIGHQLKESGCFVHGETVIIQMHQDQMTSRRNMKTEFVEMDQQTYQQPMLHNQLHQNQSLKLHQNHKRQMQHQLPNRYLQQSEANWVITHHMVSHHWPLKTMETTFTIPHANLQQPCFTSISLKIALTTMKAPNYQKNMTLANEGLTPNWSTRLELTWRCLFHPQWRILMEHWLWIQVLHDQSTLMEMQSFISNLTGTNMPTNAKLQKVEWLNQKEGRLHESIWGFPTVWPPWISNANTYQKAHSICCQQQECSTTTRWAGRIGPTLLLT